MTILDENRIPSILAVSSTDGSTIIPVCGDPVTHSMCAADGVSGTDLSTNLNTLRDDNRKTALWALSAVDGVTPVQLYCDTNGNLLINQN